MSLPLFPILQCVGTFGINISGDRQTVLNEGIINGQKTQALVSFSTCIIGKPDAASYEVYRLLVGADSQGDREIVKKRRRKDKDGSSELEGEEVRQFYYSGNSFVRVCSLTL